MEEIPLKKTEKNFRRNFWKNEGILEVFLEKSRTSIFILIAKEISTGILEASLDELPEGISQGFPEKNSCCNLGYSFWANREGILEVIPKGIARVVPVRITNKSIWKKSPGTSEGFPGGILERISAW